MKTIEDLIKNSQCFGLAYDGEVKECKVCEVRFKCERMCKGEQTYEEVTQATATTEEVLDKQEEQTATPKKEETKSEVKADPSSPQRPPSTPLADKDEVSNSDQAIKKARTKETDTKAKKPTNRKKSAIVYSEDMPDFKGMGLDRLMELLVERKAGNPEELKAKYAQESILRMRVTMALKKTYEK